MDTVLLLEEPTATHQAYSKSIFRLGIDSSARDGNDYPEWGSAAWMAERGQSCSRLSPSAGRTLLEGNIRLANLLPLLEVRESTSPVGGRLSQRATVPM